MAHREGFHTATPYVVIRNAAAAMEFYKKAFGATELMRHADPDGKVRHGEIKIGDSPIMICNQFGEASQITSAQSLGGSQVQVFSHFEVEPTGTRCVEFASKSRAISRMR